MHMMTPSKTGLCRLQNRLCCGQMLKVLSPFPIRCSGWLLITVKSISSEHNLSLDKWSLSHQPCTHLSPHARSHTKVHHTYYSTRTFALTTPALPSCHAHPHTRTPAHPHTALSHYCSRVFIKVSQNKKRARAITHPRRGTAGLRVRAFVIPELIYPKTVYCLLLSSNYRV